MINLYPLLNSKIIFRQIQDKEKYKSKLIVIDGKEIDLNESSEKVVMECDGSNSINDIALKLSKTFDKTPPETIQARTESLLEALKNQGVVDFLNEPVKEKKRRILPKQPHGKYPLINLFIECTDACNLKCNHCYLGDIVKITELPLGDIKSTLDQFSEIGGEYFTISGGEPFLRKDIFDIIEYASSRPLFVSVFSNGALITEEIAKKLSQYNIKEVQISLDGAKPETHDTYRGIKGAFKSSVKAIEALKREGIKVDIATIVNKLNMNELNEIIDMCKTWDTIPGLSHQEPKGRANVQGKDYQLSYNDHYHVLIKARKYIAEKTTQKPFNIKVPVELNLDGHRCSAGLNSLTVRCNGDVYPCLDLNMPRARLGNIKENTINQIWNSDHEFLAQLRRWRLRDLTFCRDCKHLIYCNGGCPVTAYGVWGDYNMPDPKNCGYFTLAQEYLTFEKRKEGEGIDQMLIKCDK